MADVDWDGVLAKYRPLLDRIATRDDLSELFWEVIGELGSSHAYESPPSLPVEPGRVLGHLGADLERAGDRWRVAAGAARRVVGARRPGAAVRARRGGPGRRRDPRRGRPAGRPAARAGAAAGRRRRRAGRADRAAGRRRGGAPGRGAAARRREGAALPGLGGRPAGRDARAVRRPGRLPAHPGHGGQRLGPAAPRPHPRGGPGGPGRRRAGQQRRPHLRAGAGEARPHGQGLGQPARQPGGDLPGERAARPDRRGDQPARRAPTATSSPPASRSTASARWSAPAPGAA